MIETTINHPSRPTVALLGAGTMGSGMAQRMLDLGFPVNVWNRTPGQVIALTKHGATARAKPTEAVAAAEIVVTMLSNADAVADVMLGGGTLDAVRANATWAQMGTIGVEATERLGVPYAVLADAVVGGPLASATALAKLAKMERGDYSADFSLEWALKDLDLALAASGAETTPVVMAIAERWRRLVAQGHGHFDISAARLGLAAGPRIRQQVSEDGTARM